MVREGANLMQAAQWLDKKQTIKTSQQLREAIQQSILEALTLRSDESLQGFEAAVYAAEPQRPAQH